MFKGTLKTRFLIIQKQFQLKLKQLIRTMKVSVELYTICKLNMSKMNIYH